MPLALTIVAVILFVLAALGVAAPKYSLGWLALAFWSLSTIIGKVAG